jgi:hypothetical protein
MWPLTQIEPLVAQAVQLIILMWLLTQIEPLVTRAVRLITQGFIYNTLSLAIKQVT